MKRSNQRLRLAAGCAVLLLACVLPGEPSGDERIQFQLDFALPYRVPLAGTAEPAIRITAGGQVLTDPLYRLESLDEEVLRVDATGRGLEGVARGNVSVRVIYQTATGAPDTVFPVQIVVSRIAVGPADTTLTRLGATTQLSATAYDAKDASVPDVAFTWSSAQPELVTVNDAGLLRAVDEGTVEIRAEADSVKGLASVTVTQVAAQVRLAPEVDTLRTVGRSVHFIAVALDSTGRVLQGAKPRWTSSDSAVARVDAAGLATATGGGTARIIARVGESADTASLVVAQVIRLLVVDPAFDTLTAIADTTRVAALAFDSLNFAIPNPTVTWTSSDTNIAALDQAGLIRSRLNGVVLVTASTGGHSAFATVVVRQEVADVSISRDSVVLMGVGDTIRLSAVALDRNGYPVDGAVLTWRSDAGCVTAIDAAGLVTALGGGRTDVVAAPPNTGKPDTATVDVMGAPPARDIAFVSRQGIEVMCDDGSGRRVLIASELSGPLGLVGDPAWSPDGTSIAFAGGFHSDPNTYDWKLYTARVDGSELRLITSDSSSVGVRYPAWSPDGRRIAFARVSGVFTYWGSGISVVDADGSNLRELLPRIVEENRGYSFPTWAPDGTKLASSGQGQGSADFSALIWVVNADGTGLGSLTAPPTYDADPVWSPDGSALAFTRNDDIWVMNVDGSGARNLTSSPARDAQPTWSPDGSRLLFVSGLVDGSPDDFFYEPPSQANLYVVNRDGTGLRRLTSAEGFEMYPAWRPTSPP